MEFFGLTSYGISDPIKFIMKSEYKEPINPPQISEYFEKGPKQPFHEAVREIDLYGGVFDGYSYRSTYRNSNFKERGFRKPAGPADMYISPVCHSMIYGWWLSDSALNNATWYKPNCFLPKPKSETTKFLDQALKTDKTFIL